MMNLAAILRRRAQLNVDDLAEAVFPVELMIGHVSRSFIAHGLNGIQNTKGDEKIPKYLYAMKIL